MNLAFIESTQTGLHIFPRHSSSHTWAPFTNATTFRLLKWFYNSDKKTLEDLDRLVYDVLLQPDFSVHECEDFSAAREARRLDKPDIFNSDVWKQDSVEIRLPQKDFAWNSETEAPVVKVDGVWHRSLTEVITSAFQDSLASNFHLKGYKEMWKASEDSPAERIYGEVYTSPAYLEMEEKVRAAQAQLDMEMASKSDTSDTDSINDIQTAPVPASPLTSTTSINSNSTVPSESDSERSSSSSTRSSPLPSPLKKPTIPPHIAIENIVVPIMVYTDSTHLANFGDASLWPGYLFVGLLSKLLTAMPDAYAAHHFVYMPELPDIIQDVYQAKFGEPAPDALLTHLKRELAQAVWHLLLDDEFKDAYRHGVIVQCWDGIFRRLFPRFFAYSADYPEKMLMACLKTLGMCLCPRCLIRKPEVSQMGTINDIKRRLTKAHQDNHPTCWRIEEARKKIFLKGKAINSTHVEALLKDESLIPTWNAFSEFFQDVNVDMNFYILFIIDLMHEFELGVFKALFIHLIRICYAIGAHAVQILNERYGPAASMSLVLMPLS
ncbi:hypothetical protein IW261DRAFT_1564281 [Armillaria novae-zelandiae]|uniref:Uncharacterized protein n=1 Tax=Armillaria novae-zelandiae TaxID=153914 RepID=A0AA39P8M1_9AGAR|nr:hypothetical protein IW261DRAFT_1564281 [Armillaria novae-zelandiae]